MEVALVRYGEISLKSDRVRRRMERKLRENIERQTGGKTFKKAARIVVVGGDWKKISKVFGVVSWSPAMEVRADLNEIAEAAADLLKDHRGSFKVETQRVTKDFPLTSPEVSKEVGAQIVEKLGLKVVVKEPDIVLGVEIIGRRAYVFKERFQGPGGLPVGVEGDAVLLFSGGIDSPVAGWMIGKRGVTIHPFHLYAGIDVSRVLKKLSEWFPEELELKIEKVDRKRIVEFLKKKGRLSYFYLVMKGIMFRRAEAFAEEIGADALVTGESIGQVSSQTLRNLRALDSLVNISVLRPLAGLNKDEIVALARKIGTYEESIRLPEPCAEVKVKPVVRADLETLRELVEEVEG